ncbi:MAG: aldose 1-epimerase family protein, partial [Clostridia bacterium]|nr:aldose 1-epimerase family protein [Clostridia bacterium]
MRCIENEALRVQVSDLGAELSAMYDKTNGRDVLWTADPAYWDRHAPILFPFVGRVYKNIYRYDGKEWPMTQHGFARDLEFECIACTETTVTHRLCADEKSKALYPFDYVLTVTHRLEGNTLHVEWLVENKGEKEMYFSIGGHPGFLCPVLPGTKQTDYFIYLPDQPEYVCKSVDVTTGTIFPDKDFIVAPENGRLPITEHTFDHDALVFDDNQAKTVGILYPDGKPYITMQCPD